MNALRAIDRTLRATVRKGAELLRPRLEVVAEGDGRLRLVNTTGDVVDPASTILLPRATAVVGETEEGREVVLAGVGAAGEPLWVPREVLRETPGEGGMYYLPTYRKSLKSAALGGALYGFTALGPVGAAAGLAGGVAGTRASGGRALRALAGAAAGAAAAAAGTLLLGGPTGLPPAALVGGLAGGAAALAGEGEAAVRDGIYGGSLAGTAAGMFTGLPLLGLTGAVAAALGGRARSRPLRVAVGAAAGSALTAAQAALNGAPRPWAAAVGAAAGAVGPLVGPPLMQVMRNLSYQGGEALRRRLHPWIRRRSKTSLKLLWGLPFAAGGALAGATLGLPGAIAGVVVGQLLGTWQGHRAIERLEAEGAKGRGEERDPRRGEKGVAGPGASGDRGKGRGLVGNRLR